MSQLPTSNDCNNITVIIRDTTFMNNAAGSYFFSFPIKTTLKIQNCNFVNNYSDNDYNGVVTSSEVIEIDSLDDIFLIGCTFFA